MNEIPEGTALTIYLAPPPSNTGNGAMDKLEPHLTALYKILEKAGFRGWEVTCDDGEGMPQSELI